MAESLLAHLYSRIKGSQEDVATMSLQYLLSQSSAMKQAFTDLVASSLNIDIWEELQYSCQSVGENKERPDMVGKDRTGTEVVLCEMKFYAGLTHNQPLGYLDRIAANEGKGLVFICPKVRESSLWNKLLTLCKDREVEEVKPYSVLVDGIPMAILSWGEVIETLKKEAPAESLSDLQQLEGFCNQMDSDAFIPYTIEDLSIESAKKAQRPYDVIDQLATLVGAATEDAQAKGKSFSSRTYYERKVEVKGYTLSLMYDRELWRNTSSAETPFWMSIYDLDWQQSEEFQRNLLKVPEDKKDNEIWQMVYFALEPLTDATIDEVVQDLKEQVFHYFNIFCAEK